MEDKNEENFEEEDQGSWGWGARQVESAGCPRG